MKKHRATVDFVLFNLCWTATALGVLYNMTYLGPSTVLLSCAIHLTLVDGVRSEVIFLAITSVIGYFWDTLLLKAGILGFPMVAEAKHVPLWLFAQWIAFGLLFRHSIRWLRDHPVFAIVLGASGGPLSYYSATGLNILSLGDPLWQALAVMALGWAVIVPVLGRLSFQLEQGMF